MHSALPPSFLRIATLTLCAALPVGAAVGCSSDASQFEDGPGSSGGASSSGVGIGGGGASGGGGGNGSSGQRIAIGCGNGIIDPGEACDDTNEISGDGCSADCREVERGYRCGREGAVCSALCGDGRVLGTEACDDGNTLGSDGCSESCQLEPGFQCLAPSTPCTVTTCGNGVKEGLEQCDDGNVEPYDGCYACALEPVCNGAGCAPICGDGLVYPGEDCDDGNARSGDGCSATCVREVGYACENRVEALPSEIVLPVIYRDFKSPYLPSNAAITPFSEPANAPGGHPDFEHYLGTALPGGATTELVMSTLGPDGKPVYNPAGDRCAPGQPDVECRMLTGASELNEWYHAGERGRAVTRTLTLPRLGQSDRYQFDSSLPPFGDFKFLPIDDAGWGAPSGKVCRDVHYSSTTFQPDGFIPIQCFAGDYDAQLPNCVPPFGPTNFQCIGYDDVEHNFLFTTELHFWFTYQDPGNDVDGPELAFSGDDDVWIFINGRRVIDLGGLHAYLTRDFKLTRAAATALGITANGVYDVALFHAERRSRASNFKFTLGGFLKAKTACTPTCGDGVKTPTETCDDGTNAGGYNQCAPGCVWGPRCGDGIVQTDQGEQCDDRNLQNRDGCTSDCLVGNGGPN